MKKLYAMMASLVVCFLCISPIALAETADEDRQCEAVSVYTLTNIDHCINTKDVQFQSKTLDLFRESSMEELSAYDVIQLSKEDTDCLVKEGNLSKIIQLVDDGVILYVQDNSLKEEELAAMLSIPYEGITYASGGRKIGIALMRINNYYIFDNQFCGEAIPVGSDPVIATANAESIAASIEYADQLSGSPEVIEEMLRSRKAINEYINIDSKPTKQDTLNLQSLPGGYTYYNYNTRTITSWGNTIGWEHITQYIFVKNTESPGDGHTYKVFDTTTRFTASAEDNNYIQNYTGRIHSNITNHDVFDHAYLNSNSQNTFGVNLSGSYNSSSGFTIGGGSNTSWTYTPDSQNITNYFPAADYREWRVTVLSVRWGNSWLIEPGIRSVNTCAESGQSGAFSSFRKITIHGISLSYTTTSVFEIGRWF